MTAITHLDGLDAEQRARQSPAAGKSRSIGNRVVSAVFTLVLVTAAVAFLFLAVGPRFVGYQTSTMLTGSMSPGINPGDVVVTVPVPVEELRIGDVITYSIPVDDHRVETHRIVEMTTAGGVATVQTKGDANPGVDPWKAVLSGNRVYRHVATVPYLGTVIRTLREPVTRSVLLYGATGVLVVGVLASIWSRKPEEKPEAVR
ncbi:signal peptidase I [Arthrobacter globiformis]|uniref:signal peptidase I n=1 Tax=Arthrobacter globiformis TaxID=1665 RepID=UPI00278E4332|nr:signal peptidase I [Arthrobacter globiformis]MDQ0620077.1 signal peptidase [Arthrobacter globiformis]